MNLMNPGQQEHRARPHRVYSNTLRLVRMGRVCRAEAGTFTPYIHHTLSVIQLGLNIFAHWVWKTTVRRGLRVGQARHRSLRNPLPRVSVTRPKPDATDRLRYVPGCPSLRQQRNSCACVAGTRDCEEFLHWLRHPLRDSIKGLETGYKNAVAAGNPAFAGGCAYGLANTLWAVCPLPQILSTIGTQSSQAQ